MKCILDESVSYGLAEVLRNKGYSVTAIAESSTTGIADTEVFKLVVADRAVLITRDAHFTNAVRFPSEKTGGIIYIRRGNLTAPEEGSTLFTRSKSHPGGNLFCLIFVLYLYYARLNYRMKSFVSQVFELPKQQGINCIANTFVIFYS